MVRRCALIVDDRFGARLRELREARGFPRVALARRAGLTLSRLRDLEYAPNLQPRPDELRRLAAVLDVTEPALAGREAAA